MSPWDVIGWMLVVVIGVPLAGAGAFGLLLLALALAVRASRWWGHRRTRNISPAVGQRWLQEGSVLEVTKILDSGRIALRCGAVSWSDSPEQWRNRVRTRKLELVDEGGTP